MSACSAVCDSLMNTRAGVHRPEAEPSRTPGADAHDASVSDQLRARPVSSDRHGMNMRRPDAGWRRRAASDEPWRAMLIVTNLIRDN